MIWNGNIHMERIIWLSKSLIFVSFIKHSEISNNLLISTSAYSKAKIVCK